MTFPWYKFYGDTPEHLDYFEGSLYQAVLETGKKYPSFNASLFFGKKTTYSKLLRDIQTVASSFSAIGVKKFHET